MDNPNAADIDDGLFESLLLLRMTARTSDAIRLWILENSRRVHTFLLGGDTDPTGWDGGILHVAVAFRKPFPDRVEGIVRASHIGIGTERCRRILDFAVDGPFGPSRDALSAKSMFDFGADGQEHHQQDASFLFEDWPALGEAFGVALSAHERLDAALRVRKSLSGKSSSALEARRTEVPILPAAIALAGPEGTDGALGA